MRSPKSHCRGSRLGQAWCFGQPSPSLPLFQDVSLCSHVVRPGSCSTAGMLSFYFLGPMGVVEVMKANSRSLGTSNNHRRQLAGIDDPFPTSPPLLFKPVPSIIPSHPSCKRLHISYHAELPRERISLRRLLILARVIRQRGCSSSTVCCGTTHGQLGTVTKREPV